MSSDITKNKKIEVVMIPMGDIVPDENQPRKLFEPQRLNDLAESIRKFGIKLPLVLEKIGNKYLIEDGERRYRASQILGLEEVPAVITAPKNSADRLVEQFHIQEQHEAWTATEKAITVNRLAGELGLSLKEICTLLAIPARTAQRYIHFSNILEKKAYDKNEIGIDWAGPIVSLKRIAKNITADKLEEDFDRNDEKKLELAVINRIKSGDIKNRYDLVKIKDSFTKEPKSIKEFMNTQIRPEALFIKTKAKGAYYLRNAVYNSTYVTNNLRRFMEVMDVKVSEEQVDDLKQCMQTVKAFLDKIE